ncbi:hypothetical protein DFR58_101251 [Anaerobacterium chartisolvens]|uniref:DUF8091 domain-containing protein n=1 Tax=Anaerobacterium chartisolvens TaxID=1297424 RepID=A0A369BHK0_9FIRM|nr:hypothetical protein [Anaerobacterium chartisolvens]RCX21042.1 hypothetical protein DFR58_101251 [Anaerobacterium chartisolvens]
MTKEYENVIYGQNGINTEKESSLHKSVKEGCGAYGGKVEVRIDGFIVDAVKNGLLIEVQTGNFASIKDKLKRLAQEHKVRLVYPVAQEKLITRISSEGEIINTRKSPRRGRVTDIFNELIRFPELVNNDNFTIEVLLARVEEIRCDDGKGSWRRKGVSIKDKRLIEIFESIVLENKKDFSGLLPKSIEQPFSSRDLAAAGGYPVNTARKITYCLKKMGALRECGKKGNLILYEII